MLTADVRFEGWTTEDFVRFVRLWQPRAQAEADSTRPRGGLLVLHDGARLLKVLHTDRGRVPITGAWPASLGELAAAHRTTWVLAVHTGTLEEIMERFGARVRREDDLTAQALRVTQIVREMMHDGRIERWPARLRGIGPPTDAQIHRALDAVCPDGRAVCLGLFDAGALYTALFARRCGRAFDLIAGPDLVRPDLGPLSGDWRRDCRRWADAFEQRYAPLGLGCFAELPMFLTLQKADRAGAWSRAVAVRDVVLWPMPLGIGLALATDAAFHALEQLRALAARLDPFGLVDLLLRRAESRVVRLGGGPAAALGFNPLEVLRALLQRS